GREHDLLRGQHASAAVVRLDLDALAGEELAVTLQRRDTCALEQRQDAAGHALHDGRLALLHGGQIERHTGRLDAVDRQLRLHLVIQLGRLEQRLGRNAAGVEAGTAESRRAVEVLPLVDARDAQLVLTGADRGRIARRTATD